MRRSRPRRRPWPSGTRRPRATSPASRRAASRAASPSRAAALATHHHDGPDLHEVAPGLRHAPFGCARDLAGARLATELPEELGDLHEAGRRDRVADAEEAAARARGQIALAVEDAVSGRLGRLALVEQQQALEVVQLLVVEGVVGLGDVDLLARLGHAGHPVGHASRVRDVVGEHEVAVGPVGGVEVPPYALDPDRVARDLLRGLLARHHDRDGAVAHRRDVEALHRPRERLGREHVLDRDLGLSEERRGVTGCVPLVLHGERSRCRACPGRGRSCTGSSRARRSGGGSGRAGARARCRRSSGTRPAGAAASRTPSPRPRRARRRPSRSRPCTRPGWPTNTPLPPPTYVRMQGLPHAPAPSDEVLALHVHAVERVGRARETHRVDVVRA